MKLLFDENPSHKLPRRLSDIFPDSLHVRDVGLKAADDPLVWDYAKDDDFIIVSKDADMHDLSLLFGNPQFIVRESTESRLVAAWELFNVGRGKFITS